MNGRNQQKKPNFSITVEYLRGRSLHFMTICLDEKYYKFRVPVYGYLL